MGTDDRIPSQTTDRYWLVAINENHWFQKPRDERESGKWLLFAPWPEIDYWWPIVCESLLKGELGHSAKVSTKKENPNASGNETGVICLFTDDFNDKKDVFRVAAAVRQLGITARLVYKLDRDVGKYLSSGYRDFPPLISYPTGMIRPLTTNDIPAFLALRKQSWSTDPLSWDHEPDEKIDPAKWEGIISGWDNGSVLLGFFLTEEGREPELVGLAGLQRYTAPKRSHRAMIWGVYVDPSARGQGISGKLLEESLARARRMEGLHHVILSVSHHATAAIRLYERAGFVEWGREVAAARTGEVFMDEVHMGLAL